MATESRQREYAAKAEVATQVLSCSGDGGHYGQHGDKRCGLGNVLSRRHYNLCIEYHTILYTLSYFYQIYINVPSNNGYPAPFCTAINNYLYRLAFNDSLLIPPQRVYTLSVQLKLLLVQLSSSPLLSHSKTSLIYLNCLFQNFFKKQVSLYYFYQMTKQQRPNSNPHKHNEESSATDNSKKKQKNKPRKSSKRFAHSHLFLLYCFPLYQPH